MKPCHILRKLALCAFLLYLPLLSIAAVTAPSPDLRTVFELRYQAWQRWCDEHRTSSTLTGNQPFKDLLALGPQAIPLFLDKAEVQADNGYGISMIDAVAHITKIRLPAEREAKSNRERVGLYLKWWHEDRRLIHPESPETYQQVGIDILPTLIANFRVGRGFDFLPLFNELTDHQGVPDEGTPGERARDAVAWWEVNKAAWTMPPSDPVRLQIALVIGMPKTTLNFTLINQRAWTIQVPPMCVNESRLLITDPEEKEHAVFSNKDMDSALLPTISAGGQQSWNVETSSLFRLYDLTAPGLYRLTWDYRGIRSAEVLLSMR